MQNIQLPAGAADAQTAPDTIFGQSVRNPLAPCRLEKEKLLPDQNSVNCNSVTNPSFGLCSDFQSIDSIKKHLEVMGGYCIFFFF